MPIVSGVRAELDVDARHIFPQDVLAMITLIGYVPNQEAVRSSMRQREESWRAEQVGRAM